MKNKKNTELAVCGLAAVKALGKEHPEKIKRFYYEGGRAGVFGDLCKYLAKNKIPYNKVEAEDLEKLLGSQTLKTSLLLPLVGGIENIIKVNNKAYFFITIIRNS